LKAAADLGEGPEELEGLQAPLPSPRILDKRKKIGGRKAAEQAKITAPPPSLFFLAQGLDPPLESGVAYKKWCCIQTYQRYGKICSRMDGGGF